MKKTKQLKPVSFGDYLLVNHEKLDRVINGAMASQGRLSGGLGKDASAEEIIAEYDRLGGLILTNGGQKVETGTFYDFVNRKAKDKITLNLAKKKNERGMKIKTENIGDDENKRKSRKAKELDEDEDLDDEDLDEDEK